MAFSKNEYPLTNTTASTFSHDGDASQRRDELDMARFGKKQQLRRHFGLVSIVGLTCTLMITWEAMVSGYESGLTNGGPAGLVYGFVFAWIGSGSQALVMGELGSMIPLAGGYYNWVAVLAPRGCSNFLSYLTGWLSVIGYQANIASVAFISGTMIQGLLVLNYPGYTFARWHGTLLFYAILSFSLLINTYLARLLPKVESMVLIVHIVGFFIILIPLVYLAPHGSAADVFATFTNNGGWSSDGVSFFIGLSTSMYSFIGSDAASHMAEEIYGASIVIPRSMIASVLINGFLGLGILIAILFSLGDEKAAMESLTGFPYIEVFRNATGSNGGATAMAWVIIAAFSFATTGFLATASRMTWAFAREKGLPGSSFLSRVEPRTLLPLYSIGLCTISSLLLALINIGSEKAFDALISVVIASYYSAFVMSAGVLLHKRLTTPADRMIYGPFRLGRAGVPIIVFSLVFSVIGIFFSFWPATRDVTVLTMNWSIAVFGGVLLFSMAFWGIYGRKVYTGPVLEIVPY